MTNLTPHKLIYAIGLVTYLHASGLEEALAQLIGGLVSRNRGNYVEEYEKALEMGVRRKIRLLSAASTPDLPPS